MDHATEARILIVTDRVATAQRWAEMLREPGTTIWQGTAEVPPHEQPEVVLTDSDRIDQTTAGVVRFGAGPADVHLPDDATPRELRLACRLLARVVRVCRHEQSRVELCRRLSQQALTDPLTELPNRRAWDEVLRQRLAMALDSPQNPPRQLCVALLDLDHFKRINDAHGHTVGDEVLQATGRAITDGLRQDDFAARLGGDEFGLLLWVPDRSVAATVVERVRAALPSRLLSAASHVVSASAGYRVWSGEPGQAAPELAADLYAAADTALREAKHQGRDRTIAGCG